MSEIMNEKVEEFGKSLRVPNDVVLLLQNIEQALKALSNSFDPNPLLNSVVYEMHMHMSTIKIAIHDGVFDPSADRKTMHENLAAVRAYLDRLLDMSPMSADQRAEIDAAYAKYRSTQGEGNDI